MICDTFKISLSSFQSCCFIGLKSLYIWLNNHIRQWIYYLKRYLWTPGAIMLLFEGFFGTILHTGDCRLAQECLQSLPEKYLGTKTKEPQCSIDYIFLDCTFGRFSKMPSRNSAIRQVYAVMLMLINLMFLAHSSFY